MQFKLDQFMPYRLSALAERISQRTAAEYGQSHGLGVAEWRVLAHLAVEGQISIRDIHRKVNLGKSRVSRAVDRLEKNGLVGKWTDADDARLLVISLTARGQRSLDEIIPEVLAVEATLLSVLSLSERKIFDRVIDKLNAALDTDLTV